jgi:CMP-2-keto-3-deoxyoctulosonic acid synthetase
LLHVFFIIGFLSNINTYCPFTDSTKLSNTYRRKETKETKQNLSEETIKITCLVSKKILYYSRATLLPQIKKKRKETKTLKIDQQL